VITFIKEHFYKQSPPINRRAFSFMEEKNPALQRGSCRFPKRLYKRKLIVFLLQYFSVINIQPVIQNRCIYLFEIHFEFEIAFIQIRKIRHRIQYAFLFQCTADQKHIVCGSVIGTVTRVLRNPSAEFTESK
jgi:hypothetical protein